METIENANEVAELEELDIEVFAKAHPEDRKKPPARVYIIRIDRERRRVRESELNGTQILALVDKTPETHKLFQKFRGGQTEVIEPCEVVSFVEPGIERFQTIPKDTTEGAFGG
jgi:Multiubiquitin